MEPLTEAAEHLSDPGEPAVLLDLGCGSGSAIPFFGALGYRVVGVDHDESLLRAARARGTSASFVLADVNALPFRDGTFGALATVSVFQYVDWPRLLEEASRVLEVDGRAVFVENLRHNPLVLFYRLLSRLAQRYPEGLLRPLAVETRPRRHLAWAERNEIRSRFRTTRFRPYHVVSPVALVIYTFRRSLGPRALAVTERLYAGCAALDRWLLSRVPAVAKISWLVVVTAEKEPATGWLR